MSADATQENLSGQFAETKGVACKKYGTSECSGKCKHLQQLSENGNQTFPLHSTLIVDGQEKPFGIHFNQ